MSDLARLLRNEIERYGPIPFSRFMEVALYQPGLGYYRRGADPFGIHGDYYTAEQIQPSFGLLIARFVERAWQRLNKPTGFTVVELGAGRRELQPFLQRWNYVGIEVGEALPDNITGLVLANEFFDALPVEVAVFRGDEWYLRRVGWSGNRFVWVDGEPASAPLQAYLRTLFPEVQQGQVIEVSLDALRWIDRIGTMLRQGGLLVIDYGYTAREILRFPEGTLMSYQGHRADPDVLKDPGRRDITAHVCFTALESQLRRTGFDVVRLSNFAQFLLSLGEADQFAFLLEVASAEERLRRRLQLKTLLFGMGETFRVLEAWKQGAGQPT